MKCLEVPGYGLGVAGFRACEVGLQGYWCVFARRRACDDIEMIRVALSMWAYCTSVVEAFIDSCEQGVHRCLVRCRRLSALYVQECRSPTLTMRL